MKKKIKDYIDYDFHTPNIKEVREFLKDNFELSGRIGEWESGDKHITPTYSREALYTTDSSWGVFIPTEKFMKLIGMSKKSNEEFDSLLEHAHSLVKQIEELWSKAKSQIDTKQENIRKELEFAEAKKQRLENHINILKSKLNQ